MKITIKVKKSKNLDWIVIENDDEIVLKIFDGADSRGSNSDRGSEKR